MNPLIKPVFLLMNRLSYRAKLSLIASLFAIPLVIFAVQLAVGYHYDANQAKQTREGLKYLKAATELIKSLETVRDLSVINLAQESKEFSLKYDHAVQQTIGHIGSIQSLYNSLKHQTYLNKLSKQVSSQNTGAYSEGAAVFNIYESMSILVERSYDWRTKLSHELISRTASNTQILDILNMLNESGTYLYVLGKTRAFGSLYLDRQYIDSHGIQVIDQNYQALSRMIQQVDVHTVEHAELLLAYPELLTTEIKNKLSQAHKMLDENLIQPLSLEADAVGYYQQVEHIFDEIYLHNDKLFELADQLLEARYKSLEQSINVFYLSVGLMLILIIYLYVGLYYSVGNTIRQLLKSATRVAKGDYETPIAIDAVDELQAVANAMNTMRKSIKEREKELVHLGQTDGLTQLYNRQYFDDALAVFLANSSRNNTSLTLVMMDIDYFKTVNDEYGHLVGDECLRQVAASFRNHFQRKTDIVARYGGEEFIAILNGLTHEEAKSQVESLRASIETDVIVVDNKTISITASFGIATVEAGTLASEDGLLSMTDDMLYTAKNQGRNCVASALYDESNVLRVAGKK